MRAVIWSQTARIALRDYVDYLETHNEQAAKRANAEIVEAARRLGRFAFLGRRGRDAGTRELSLPRWSKIIVYEVSGTHVEILTVLDPRRDV